MTSPGSTVQPLTAGELRSRIVLQSESETVSVDGVIVPTWSTLDTVWARKRAVGLAEQLASEQSAPRRTWDLSIRRRSTALPTPLRVLHGTQVLFALAAIDDEVIGDQTTLRCVDGISFARAETVTVYRGTDARQADGSTKRAWAPVATDVAFLLDDADAEYVERVFGLEVQAHLRATADIASDVRLGDGVVVTAGRHIGERFLVSARRVDPTLPAQAYWALALRRTTEAFT